MIGRGLRGDSEARRKAQRQADYINEWLDEQEEQANGPAR